MKDVDNLVLLVFLIPIAALLVGGVYVGVTQELAEESVVADLDARGGLVYLDTPRSSASSAPVYTCVHVPASASVSLSGGMLRLSGVTVNYDDTIRDLAVELGSVQYIVINGGA